MLVSWTWAAAPPEVTAERADASISVEYRPGWPKTLGLEVLSEPVLRILPSDQGLLLVIAGARVVVEGVLRAGIDLEIVRDVRGLECRVELIAIFIGEIVGIGRVDAEHSRLDVPHGVERWGCAIPRGSCLEG